MMPIHRHRGAVLVLSMILMFVLAVITGGYIYFVSQSMRLVNSQQNDARAFYLAEAGLNKAVWYLMHTAPDGSSDGSWRTGGYPQAPGPNPADPREELLEDGRYTIWIEDAGALVRITAAGMINDAVRTIRQEFTSVVPVTVAAGSWREIGS